MLKVFYKVEPCHKKNVAAGDRGHYNETYYLHLDVFCVSVCVLQRPDEEVVVDQGGTSSVLNIHYEKEELEGE